MVDREKKIRAFLLASGICGEADDKETKQRIEEYIGSGLWVEFPVRELGRILNRYHKELEFKPFYGKLQCRRNQNIEF